MATQSVKFHSLSESAYEAATKTDGGLYFINDNGEIRKGSKHVTGTRVFTATDSTGTTAVGSLDIKFNGTSISGQDFPTDDKPKKGDMLVVEHMLVAASGTEGQSGYVPAKNEYAAYIYATNGGTYNSSGWQACDGNVDASKVILTENIKLAGTYANVGNIERTGQDPTFNTNGKSVMDALKEIFTKPLYPTTKQKPTVSVTMSKSKSGTDFEAGTEITTSYTCSYSDGYYKYEGGSNQMAGCTVGTWTVSGGATSGQSNTPPSGSATTLVAGTTNSVTVYAKATYSAGTNTPKDNLGNDYTYTDAGDPPDTSKNIPFVAGETTQASGSISITSYRKNFYLQLAPSDVVDITTVALDGTHAKLNSDYIRTNAGHGQKANITSINDGGTEWQQILIFRPRSSALNAKLSAKTKDNLPYINAPGNNCVGGTSSPRTIVIKGADNDNGVEYCIWEIKPGTPVSGDVIALAWA